MSADLIVPSEALRALLVDAAHEGAREALAEVGLSDANAASDVRDLRFLLDSYRGARRFLGDTTKRVVMAIIVGVALAWVGFKFPALQRFLGAE